jgi:hypothetical protein
VRQVPAWLTTLGSAFGALEAHEQSRFLGHWINDLEIRGQRLLAATQDLDQAVLNSALIGVLSRVRMARDHCVPGAQPLHPTILVELALDNRGIPAFESLLLTVTRSAVKSVGLRVD